jgi:hypothetical protein
MVYPFSQILPNGRVGRDFSHDVHAPNALACGERA